MKLFRFSGVLLAVAFLLAACTSPESTPQPGGDGPEIESGVVGTVLTRNGTPAVNQTVTFHPTGVAAADLQLASSFEASTGADGAYGIELPAGTYNAVAVTDVDGASELELLVSAGAVTEAPEMRMRPLGQVNGRALYPDRGEHIGITISVPGTGFIATSSVDGGFSLRLPEGTYELAAFQATYGHAFQSDVTVTSGEVTTLSEPLLLSDLGPQITGITPDVVMVGERIEITGSNFGDLPGSIQFGDERMDFGDFWVPEGEEPFVWTDSRIVIEAAGGMPLTVIRLDGKHATAPVDDLLILGPPQLQLVGSLENCVRHPDSRGDISCGEYQRRVPDIWAREALEVQPGETAQISLTVQLSEYGAFLDDADPDRAWRSLPGQELSLEVYESYRYCYEVGDCEWESIPVLDVPVGPLEPVEFLEVTPGLTDEDGFATVTASVVIPDELAYFTVGLAVNGNTVHRGWVGIDPLALYVLPEGADAVNP